MPCFAYALVFLQRWVQVLNVHGKDIGWPKLNEIPEPHDFPLKALKVSALLFSDEGMSHC